VADQEGSTAETLIALRDSWPDWEIWCVPRAIGGFIWCARLHGDHKVILNTGSPGELARQLVARSER
jgi:hypothetical protein